jgi:uncharacterized protein (TIGR02466 family)
MSASFDIDCSSVAVKDAWINISKPGNYQEYHIHPGSHFSLVYYIKVPENSGRIVFRSHEADKDMFPFDTHKITNINNKTVKLQPNEGDVIVFRSNLSHMVEKNMSNENRVCIAMNFKFLK